MMIFDLFGDPVPGNHGGRGWPAHVPTLQNRSLVSMLAARRWSNERIAGGLRITLPTLRKHYFSELKFRDVARDRLEARLSMKLWEQVEVGNVGAIKELRKQLERDDLAAYGQGARAAEPAAVEQLPCQPAEIVDHVEPYKGDPRKFCNQDAWQAASK